jgi:hypothetical protein
LGWSLLEEVPYYPGIYSPINSLSGISGTRRWFTVYGVFLSDSLPSSPPADLNYAPGEGSYTVSSATVSPELGQVFFIGDGFTGLVDGSGPVSSTGTLQEFMIPDGATRLYLGFVDDMWIDNSGLYTYNYTIVPEPGTFGLLAITGLGGLLLRHRRK